MVFLEVELLQHPCFNVSAFRLKNPTKIWVLCAQLSIYSPQRNLCYNVLYISSKSSCTGRQKAMWVIMSCLRSKQIKAQVYFKLVTTEIWKIAMLTVWSFQCCLHQGEIAWMQMNRMSCLMGWLLDGSTQNLLAVSAKLHALPQWRTQAHPQDALFLAPPPTGKYLLIRYWSSTIICYRLFFHCTRQLMITILVRHNQMVHRFEILHEVQRRSHIHICCFVCKEEGENFQASWFLEHWSNFNWPFFSSQHDHRHPEELSSWDEQSDYPFPLLLKLKCPSTHLWLHQDSLATTVHLFETSFLSCSLQSPWLSGPSYICNGVT